jgi:hypothetical protein
VDSVEIGIAGLEFRGDRLGSLPVGLSAANPPGARSVRIFTRLKSARNVVPLGFEAAIGSGCPGGCDDHFDSEELAKAAEGSSNSAGSEQSIASSLPPRGKFQGDERASDLSPLDPKIDPP